MARKRGDGFWDIFNQEWEPLEIVYPDLPPDAQDLYRNTVMRSFTYAEMTRQEKADLAGSFLQRFYYGGYTRADQEDWLNELGLISESFNWASWREIYDAVHG